MGKIIISKETLATGENIVGITKVPDDIKDFDAFASSVIPKGCSYRIADESALPQSRNWRNAWTDDNPTDTVDVDFEKAKEAHKQLIMRVAQERIQRDGFGQRDFSGVKAEIDALGIGAAQDFETLFNLWPSSIDKRSYPREYNMHKVEK